jgi:hypothetical protein
MNCFNKALVTAPVLFGLGMVGTDVTTVTWESPPAVAAGAVLELVSDAVAPSPLAAQGLSCLWCEEQESWMTCQQVLSQFPGEEVPETSSWGEYCDGQPPSTVIATAHRFHPGYASEICSGGGDPDLMLLGMGGGSGTGCRACGGESVCHEYWDAGPCHAECEDPGFAMALDALTGTGDVEGAVTLILARQPALHFEDQNGVFRVTSACGSGLLYAEFARESEFAVALRAAVSAASDT